MQLPSPNISFTIPSLRDRLPLDCRIYLPHNLCSPGFTHDAIWNGKSAVIAHPYGPLGGSYDDPVVHLIATTIIDEGFIVTTFNFRGSGGSKGRTSWTAKSEIEDYISVIGFMVVFMGLLLQYATTPPLLLMAGYSYGALITSLLPDLSDVIQRFSGSQLEEIVLLIKATATSIAQAEIERIEALRLRVRLSAQPTISNDERAINDPSVPADSRNQHLLRTTSPRRRSSTVTRYGGEDSGRRISYEDSSRNASDHVDVLRKGVNRLRSLSLTRSKRHSNDSTVTSDSSSVSVSHQAQLKNPDISTISIKAAYLLISPLQGIVKQLTIFWSISTKHASAAGLQQLSLEELKFCAYPTLAVWGSKDAFTASRKLHAWTERIQSGKNSAFRAEEVLGAGHFWHEKEAARKLKESVREFASALRQG